MAYQDQSLWKWEVILCTLEVENHFPQNCKRGRKSVQVSGQSNIQRDTSLNWALHFCALKSKKKCYHLLSAYCVLDTPMVLYIHYLK